MENYCICSSDVCTCGNRSRILQRPTVKFKKLHENAISPSIGSPAAACWDLYALEDTLFKGPEIKLVRTGWAVEPPLGYRFNMYVRSSTPLTKNFILANGVGIIDADYRGELFVQLLNIDVRQYVKKVLRGDGSWGGDQDAWDYTTYNTIKKGDKIAQIELVQSTPASAFPIEYVEELSQTKRGEGGHGSTGN